MEKKTSRFTSGGSIHWDIQPTNRIHYVFRSDIDPDTERRLGIPRHCKEPMVRRVIGYIIQHNNNTYASNNAWDPEKIKNQINKEHDRIGKQRECYWCCQICSYAEKEPWI